MIVVINAINYGDPLQHIDNITVGVKYLSDHPEKVSLVMFTGGEDVHPSFYDGEDKRGWCMTHRPRDEREKNIFEFCLKHNIKMTGICRGIQFLNVMAGGFIYQHITGHAGMTHGAYFPYDKTVRQVTSTHHQLVGLPDSAVPIAWSDPKRSDIYIGPRGIKVDAPDHEIESAIFPNINAMGVQYHPEMSRPENSSRIHYGNMIEDFIKMDMKDFIGKYGRSIHGGQRQAGHFGREA